jgi:phospholipid/cholesterol/gamma-HCH transport system permease protein
LIENFFFNIGSIVLKTFDLFIVTLGKFSLFQLEVFKLLFKRPFRIKETLFQIETIGMNAFLVIFLTAFFTGMVEAVELYSAFHKFGIEQYMGYTIFLSVCKELGPVFATLMVISRSVSAIAAELGTMKVTEQIDALDVMAVNSKQYLIVPRILGMLISLPILILMFDTIANIGAYIVSIYILDINATSYLNTIKQMAEFKDFIQGVVKGVVFAYLISAIATYVGYNTTGGAKGVGRSTTTAVVVASITVFIADYIVASMFLFFGWG